MDSHEQEILVQALHLPDPAWLSTLPHRVAPHPDEWLPGLLLRCDEANHWDSKTTLAHLLRSLRKTLTGRSNWIVVPIPVLECLAHRLAIPPEILLATTYQRELARLYHPIPPYAVQLGKPRAFHLCPACLAETRVLRRVTALPHLTACPVHLVALVSKCRCTRALQPFSQQTRPFTCPGCGLDWAQLPKVRVSPERLTVEQKVLCCYEWFFTQGAPHLIAGALQLIRAKLKKEKTIQVKLLDGSNKRVEHYELTKASLGYLVDLLVSLDLSGPSF